MSGKNLPEGLTCKCSLAHQFQCPLSHPNETHAVVNPARTQPPLGYLKPTSLS